MCISIYTSVYKINSKSFLLKLNYVLGFNLFYLNLSIAKSLNKFCTIKLTFVQKLFLESPLNSLENLIQN